MAAPTIADQEAEERDEETRRLNAERAKRPEIATARVGFAARCEVTPPPTRAE